MENIYKVNTTKSKDKKVKEFYKKAMSELKDFYNINWKTNPPIIYLVDSREAFDLIVGDKSEDWVVGKALSYNQVLFLSPESYQKESCHKYSDEEYYYLIKHELSHLFYNIYSKGYGPVWLDEGFAIYTSGELETKERPSKLSSFLDYYSYEDAETYAEAGFVVEGLIKKYGKEKVLKFIKKLRGIEKEKHFKDEFEKHFDMSLEYESVDGLL
jgi:hypothetical protein